MVQGQPQSFQERNKILIFIVVLIIAIIVVYTAYNSGPSGVFAIAKQATMYIIIAAVLGLIIFAVMKYMQVPKVDLVEDIKKNIIEAGMLSKPPMVRDLYFTGDKEHGEFRVGKIIGYCQLQSYKELDLIAGLPKSQIEEMEAKGEMPSQYIIKEDCFIFKRYPFPLSLFEEPKVLRCLEHEHSQLIGDVKVYGVSMIFSHLFFWPNRAHLDIARIDIGIIREAWRGQIHQFLKDSVAIQQRAVGLDSEFKKTMDQRKMLKIPSPLGSSEEKQ